MARPRKQVSNGRPRKQNDLASLSTEVLRLRLQALNLPITGGKATLISRLNLATGTKQPRPTSNSQAGRTRTKRLAPKSRPVRATLTAAPAESSTEQAELENPGDDSSSIASGGDLDEIMEEFSSDDSPDPVQAGPFTAAQLAAIQDTVRSSLDQALQSFPWSLGHDQQPGTFNTLHRRPGSAAPVGLNRPLEQNLQDKILRGRTFPGVGSQGTKNPLYHPAFSNDPLTEEVQTYAKWGLAWTTNRTYGSGEKRFIQFCLSNRLMSQEGDILPASEGTLIYFASYLARTVKHSTIKLYLAAVRNLHISCGHGDPLSGKLLLKKILRGILRYQGQSRILRQPVTPGVLQTIKPILHSWLGDHDFSMVWAAFTLAFFAFLRCSEFTYQGISRFRPQVDLSTDCVSFHPSLASPQRMSIFLKASKTDTFRQGHTLVIACSTSPVCAVTAMRDYFLTARPRGPLFSFRSGRLLTRSAVVNLLRDAARQVGLPYNSLKGHSFRIGAASTAAAAGLPDWLIKILGRWSSDCYQLYIRTPRTVLLSAAPRMAGVPYL
ncbi:uncharacterized protein [Porites lutea]|uniref:uncharacterized protein n=1 Tax=Porites lutea TaxID=51062 RepID=UPI003CC651AE